jgi:hypothetical protein
MKVVEGSEFITEEWSVSASLMYGGTYISTGTGS